jgi:hypothetical protein
MYDYDAATAKATNPRTLVTGMQVSGGHPTRAILVSKYDQDKILVALGSAGNIDTATTAESSGRSMIKMFSISETSKQSVSYTTGGKIVGWGLRNIVGMGEDPAYGGIVSLDASCKLIPKTHQHANDANPDSGVSKTPWTTSTSAAATSTTKTRPRSSTTTAPST